MSIRKIFLQSTTNNFHPSVSLLCPKDVLQNITSRIISPEVSNANSSIHSQNDVVQMGILPINDLQKAMKDELDKAITTVCIIIDSSLNSYLYYRRNSSV